MSDFVDPNQFPQGDCINTHQTPVQHWVPLLPFSIYIYFCLFVCFKIYLFIFGCVGSSLLHAGFL